jgi:hypothetical protein
MTRHHLFPIVLFGAVLAAPIAPQAQDINPATTGSAAETANRLDKHGIGLTPEQVKIVGRSVGSQAAQALPPDASAAVGVQIPESLRLMETPIELKDQVGALRDFKSARLQDGRILLVDPTTRLIVDVLPSASD